MRIQTKINRPSPRNTRLLTTAFSSAKPRSLREKCFRASCMLPAVFLLAATSTPSKIQEAVPEEVKIRIPELWSWGIACFFGWVLTAFKALDLRKTPTDRLLPPQD